MTENEPEKPNDLSTFDGVIDEFGAVGIDVRGAYWSGDARDFFVQVEGETALRRVKSVTGDGDRIIVVVSRDAAERMGRA